MTSYPKIDSTFWVSHIRTHMHIYNTILYTCILAAEAAAAAEAVANNRGKLLAGPAGLSRQNAKGQDQEVPSEQA